MANTELRYGTVRYGTGTGTYKGSTVRKSMYVHRRIPFLMIKQVSHVARTYFKHLIPLVAL